jgi:hypothetical protein
MTIFLISTVLLNSKYFFIFRTISSKSLKNHPMKINTIRTVFIEITKMKAAVNDLMAFTLPLIMAITIMCLIRRVYRFYALLTGQLQLSAFIHTLMNNTTEEVGFIFALCYCGDSGGAAVSAIL